MHHRPRPWPATPWVALLVFSCSSPPRAPTMLGNDDGAPRAPATGPFAPVPLLGPYASIGAYCQDVAQRAIAEYGEVPDGEPPPRLGCLDHPEIVHGGPTELGGGNGPLTAAELIAVD